MRLDDVTFAYAGEREVLSDFSLACRSMACWVSRAVRPGQVHHAQAAAAHYWDPQRGQVTLSGTPLPEVDVHARRRIQAMMSQETTCLMALSETIC